MAGNPVKHALRAELEQRVRALWPDEHERTHLDYVADWQAGGRTLRALGKELGVSAPFISEYLRATFGAPAVREALSLAREAGAHGLAEEGLEIADEANAETVNVARLRVQTREKLAAAWNGAIFGGGKGATVQLNIGTLMLDALRQPIAIVHAIESQAEIISVTDASAYDSDKRIADPMLGEARGEAS